MITISSREFRQNQKDYLDQVANGVEILVTRKNQAFKISIVSEDDTMISKREFSEMISESKKQIERGEFTKFDSAYDLDQHIRSLITEDE